MRGSHLSKAKNISPQDKKQLRQTQTRKKKDYKDQLSVSITRKQEEEDDQTY